MDSTSFYLDPPRTSLPFSTSHLAYFFHFITHTCATSLSLSLLHTWPTSLSFSLTLAPPLSLFLIHTGISGKSQVLFALVFTTRYLDIFTNFVSMYNSVMKVIFIVTAYGTLYLMFVKFKATYDSNHDTFRAEFLVIPAMGLAMLVNHEFSAMEVRK